MAENKNTGCIVGGILFLLGIGIAREFKVFTLVVSVIAFLFGAAKIAEAVKSKANKPDTGVKIAAWALLFIVISGIPLYMESAKKEQLRASAIATDKAAIEAARSLLSQGKPVDAHNALSAVSTGEFEQERSELAVLSYNAIKETQFDVVIQKVAEKKWDEAGAAFHAIATKLSSLDKTPDKAVEAMKELSDHYRKEKNWTKARDVLKRIAKTDEDKAAIVELEKIIEEERVAAETKKNLDELQSFVGLIQKDIKAKNPTGALAAQTLANKSVKELSKLGYSEKKLAAWRKKITANDGKLQRLLALELSRGPEPKTSYSTGVASCLEIAIKAVAYSPADTEVMAAGPVEDIGGKWKQTVQFRGKNAFGMYVFNTYEFHFKVNTYDPYLCEIVKEKRL